MQIFHILFLLGFFGGILTDNSCIFKHPTKGVINLSSIGLRNGQPRFRDVSSSGSVYTYSFNPCYSFMENNCKNAAVCQMSVDRLYSFQLAVQNVSTWTVDSNNSPVLTYTYGEKTVSITMMCSANAQDEFEVIGETYLNHYTMHLRSRCACWNGCDNPQSSSTTHRPPPSTTHSISYNECMYHDSRYGTIDLSTVGKINGKPRFKDMKSIYSNDFVWSYNPCYRFSEENCQNVAGCQINKTRHISYTIGLHEYAYWVNVNLTSNLGPMIIYPSYGTNRRLNIQLICDRSLSTHHLEVLGETTIGQYFMQLTSPCACWNGCGKRTSFKWTFLMITGIVSSVVFVFFCMFITCLFCSKPKRRDGFVIINEKTPIMKGAINFK